MDDGSLALLHTAVANAARFDPLIDEVLGDVERWHVVDAGLLAAVTAAGAVTDEIAARVRECAAFAERSGAFGILVTCSSLGPAVEAARGDVSIPVWRVDEPMAVEAAGLSDRIGVLATLPTTLAPTTDLIRRHAPGADVRSVVADGAFAAFQAGRAAEHDAAVRQAARHLVDDGAGVVVLAQASMADAVDGDLGVPVLTSPRSGLAQCAAAKIRVAYSCDPTPHP
jgi:Asp/Glu/hydantoin racemase